MSRVFFAVSMPSKSFSGVLSTVPSVAQAQRASLSGEVRIAREKLGGARDGRDGRCTFDAYWACFFEQEIF